jgi:C4-dicarboxylate-specific signal transduction histidine kinase
MPDTMAPAHRPRLLVVDDEPILRELMLNLFQDAYDVSLAESVVEAERIIEAGGVDLMITDKNLPDGNGIDLIPRLRDASPDAETLVITGYASLDTALSAMERGAFDYIVKPPRSIHDVRRKVDQAATRQRLARENRHLLAALARKNEALTAALEDARRARDGLVQAEKLAGLGTLAAGVAHEVSSPLFGILGLAEAILLEEDGNTVRTHASEIVAYSRSIKEIVQQLTSYARGAARDVSERMEVGEVAKRAARLVARAHGGSEADVDVDVATGVAVMGRPTELQQVFVNLIKNAVDAMRDGRRVQPCVFVRAVREADRVVIEVRDRGPGIPEDIQRSLFDPFFTTKAPGRGTGLGLNVVYRIVQSMGGAVSVQSEVGEGTTFRLDLPAAA